MTSPATHSARESGAGPASATASPHPSLLPRLWRGGQFVLALLITAGVLAFLLWGPERRPALEDNGPPAVTETVRVEVPLLIHLQSGTALADKLQIVTVRPTSITTPVLEVTGTVAASLRPVKGKESGQWQFNTSELLTTYTDWQKAQADITFTETQLAKVRELNEVKVKYLQGEAERLRKLDKTGSVPVKSLLQAETEALQAQIQGQKEIHEAETAVRLAQRAEAALARQLQQSGLEPELLRSLTPDLDIVMAEVPEAFLERVRVGQECSAQFFGIPKRTFQGKVQNIVPVISRDRRSVRVLLAIHDSKDQLRPGMFAEIGLGTNARETLLAPVEGVVHIGRADYMLVEREANVWRVTEVKVGEPHEGSVEVLQGLHASDRVLGRGAILLKPAIVRSLSLKESAGPAGGEGRRP